MHFDADGEDLVLHVSDQHNEFPVRFEERSHGLQWFFSFYLVFLVESGKAHRGAILLLDEPGLHLHPTLRAKLTALFERISATNQLIYTTHCRSLWTATTWNAFELSTLPVPSHRRR
jgi:predicted ATPase